MNKVIFQNTLTSLLLGVGVIMMPFSYAEAVVNDACSKELLLAYFPDNFVTETLKKFNVPEDQWDGIAKDLAAKDKDVVKEVEEKAAKLNPNPLKDRSPEQRQAAVKIFRESLLDIFSNVLKAHGVTDDKQIQAMLADIQQQKAKNFAQCMEKQKTQFEKDRSAQPSQISPGQVQAPGSQAKPQPNTDTDTNSPSASNPDDGFFSLADDTTDATDVNSHDDDDENNNDNEESDDSTTHLKLKTTPKPAPKPKADGNHDGEDSVHGEEKHWNLY